MVRPRSVCVAWWSVPWSSRRLVAGLVALLALFASTVPHASVAGADGVYRAAAPWDGASRTAADPAEGMPGQARSSTHTSTAAVGQIGRDRPGDAAGPDVSWRSVHRDAERRTASVVAGTADDDADECPRDVQTVRRQPSAPPMLARAGAQDALTVEPTVATAVAVPSGDELPPSAVYQCNPDGRGPPRRL